MICIWVGRTQNRWGAVTRWVRQALSLPVLLSMVAWSRCDPGVFRQPVMLLAWETPMSRGHMLPGSGQHGPVSPWPLCHLQIWEGRNFSLCSGSSNRRVKSACHVKSKYLVICRMAFSSHSKSQRSAGVWEILKWEGSSSSWWQCLLPSVILNWEASKAYF